MKRRKRTTRQILAKKLDDLWAEVVKIHAGYKCEYCGKKTTLNAHHIYSRSKKSTRWDTMNGVCLCVSHHVFNSGFSAHKTPTEFVEWIKKKRGITECEILRCHANQTKKWTLKDMQIRVNTFELTIKTYKGPDSDICPGKFRNLPYAARHNLKIIEQAKKLK